MNYKIPTCTCGSELMLRMQPAFEIELKPLKNGRYPNIKKKDINLSKIIPDNYPEWLQCPNCDTEYEFIQDEKGMVKDIWKR
ncbi:hypothetical protein [Paenibacillus sp. NAIST15-1]|uniref:hypothetical protein n=1 Tax=Paenibacillus sp. NAIST15-1 TaxID=1605994 RepID=UPI00086A04CC|nr:hypothetical protein [Paenibacillus sp. NAIST15-1]GAV11415.1 hypothetical protein PBN151_1344 [Paenibacillus sp. NAIST15-1]